MKYFLIVFLFLGGCTYKEGVDYIGTAPHYVVNKAPHPVDCGCCSK